MRMSRHIKSVTKARRAGIRAFALLLAAIPAGPAAAETWVSFSLDFKFDGPSAPFVLALDKGYYRAEGLNVSIDEAPGSLETIARVAAGTYDMGFADINALIKYRDVNADAPKAVFMVYNRPPFAIVARKSRGIVNPKDLEGKIIGAPALDNAYAQWPIFAKSAGIDASKVTIENVGFAVREPMLAAGQVDAITGLSFSSFMDLKDKGVPVDDIVVLLMADYGVELYGSAIIVNPKFAASQPDAVKGFLRAFVKSLKETVKTPATAIGPVLRRNDAAKRSVELERLGMAIRDNIVTPEVKTNGYGGIDNARFAAAIDLLGQAYRFRSAKPKPNDVFDASYLPAATESKFN
jgi:NitT/TauT family transport system substrate-binding protein